MSFVIVLQVAAVDHAAMASFEIIHLSKGHGWLIDDFVFIKNREHKDILYLKCQEFRKNCRASAKIEGGLAYVTNDSHSHDPPSTSVHYSRKMRTKLFDSASRPENARSSVPYLYDQLKNTELANRSQSEQDEITATFPSIFPNVLPFFPRFNLFFFHILPIVSFDRSF